LKQVQVVFRPLTVLIGENDSGKSSLLDILDIALGQKSPDDSDFHQIGTGEAAETIEVILEFRLEDDDAAARTYAIDDRLRVKKCYTHTTGETFYWGRRPEDGRLAQNFKQMKASDQIELIEELDASALDLLRNIDQRAEWLQQYADAAPQIEVWIETPARWGEFLPRFERYSAMDYSAPENMILKTLRQVYEQVIYEEAEDDTSVRQPVESLRQIKVEVEARIQEKVNELLDFMRRYNKRVRRIAFDPTIDFANGLRAGEFQIDDGRGLHYLSKTGDGTKRRMFIATLDWDREILLEQAAKDATLPAIIRGYDEPDANLHYEAQRTMYQAISDIVDAENSRIQAILCTHSLTMIDRAPAQNIRLLRLCEGCTEIEQLETDDDPDIESFLTDLARELGITNSLMFYERCYVLIEGDTEENALPLLYRRIYDHSLLEDGVKIVNVRGNGAVKEFLRLLSRNRQQLTVVFVDRDCEHSREAKLTKSALQDSGFSDEFIDERLRYIGNKEFEDAFADEAIATCLQAIWPRTDGQHWTAKDIAALRSEAKFSKALRHCVYEHTGPEPPNWSKPEFGRQLAQRCSDSEIPTEIRELFELAREIAGCAQTEHS